MTDKKKPKVLWANRYCLIDSTSGASKSTREMLIQLVKRGYEVDIIGATIFDAERGAENFYSKTKQNFQPTDEVVKIQDGPLYHTLIKTESWQSNLMKLHEFDAFFSLYRSKLLNDIPDIVWFYGGRSFDLLIPSEAKRHHVTTAAYLVNGNFGATRWCADVDSIITDSHATAKHYMEKLGLQVHPVGTFIPSEEIRVVNHKRKYVTFVNPTLQKGVGIVIQLAIYLEKRRPDIKFEIVESRGMWKSALETMSTALGHPRTELDNTVITPNTQDMRPVYRRSRVVFAPSLWWESGSRVLVEAMINGIPAIITDHGGSPEMIGKGGVKISLPKELYNEPFNIALDEASIAKIGSVFQKVFDDRVFYNHLVSHAKYTAHTTHNIDKNTNRLVSTFEDLLRSNSS